MNDDKLKEINEQIKKLEEEKKELIKNEEEITEKTAEEIFLEYEIPNETKAKDVESEVRKLSKISNYSLLLGLIVSAILYFALSSEEAISFLLGTFTSIFNYTILIKDTRNLAYVHISKYKSLMVKSNIKRMFVYIAVLFFVYVFQDIKEFSLLYTFLGMLTVKVTTFIYFIINKGGIK